MLLSCLLRNCNWGQALLMRSFLKSKTPERGFWILKSSASYLFTELFRIYPSVKLSMERMGKSGVFVNVSK